MGELADHARRPRIRDGLLGDRCSDRALQLLGAEPKPSEYGTTNGLRSRAPARSPSTIAASSGPCELGQEVGRAGCTAAAAAGGHQDDRAPGLARREHARELEQCRRRRQFRLGAPAGGVAVGEYHDRRARRSSPGAGRSPWSACVRRRSSARGSSSCCTEKPPPAVPPSASISCATCSASARSPALPGRRSGYLAARLFASAKARAPLKASGASVEV